MWLYISLLGLEEFYVDSTGRYGVHFEFHDVHLTALE